MTSIPKVGYQTILVLSTFLLCIPCMDSIGNKEMVLCMHGLALIILRCANLVMCGVYNRKFGPVQ